MAFDRLASRLREDRYSGEMLSLTGKMTERERHTMSEANPAPADQYELITKATNKFFERATPWLLNVGSWIFGGMIAFNLFLLGPLLTIGPVDLAIKISTAAFAFVLPLDVAGLFLLRLVQDLEHAGFEIDFENEVRHVMQSVVDTTIEESAISTVLEKQGASPQTRTLETVQKRRRMVALLFSLNILTLSIVLTLAGMIAALWHMSWWIGAGFAVMVVIGAVIVTIGILTSQPPESPQEKARRKRYGEEIARQARERARKDEELVEALAKERARKNEEQA